MPASEDFMEEHFTFGVHSHLTRLRLSLESEGFVCQDVVASAKACVEEGGGIWVGIQECSPYTDLVLFNSPETGSTLALKTTAITPELVASKIKNSNAQFRRTK
jgi:hypothetical protein